MCIAFYRYINENYPRVAYLGCTMKNNYCYLSTNFISYCNNYLHREISRRSAGGSIEMSLIFINNENQYILKGILLQDNLD